MTSLVGAGLLALALSAALTPVCRRAALAWRIVDLPRPNRWHRTPVPLLGGVAVMVAVAVATVAWTPSGSPPWAVLGGGAAIFGLGVVDDLRGLSPVTKLVGQTVIAACLNAFGLQLDLFDSAALNVASSVFWVVALVNAFNLLDHMDGLAAGVAVVAGGFQVVFFATDGNLAEAVTAAALAGAAMGFLLFNFPPAGIFLGDAGSLLIGYFIASLSLSATFPYSRSVVSILLVPVMSSLVPILDVALVTVTRRLTGRRIMVGGRDHSSHRLVALGLSDRQAVLTLYALAVTCGVLGLLSARYGLSRTAVLFIMLVVGVGWLGVRLAAAGPELSRPQDD